MVLLAYMAPVTTFAQVKNITTLITKIEDIFDLVIVLIIGLAFVVFLWGVYQYVVAAGPDEKTKGKTIIIYGVIGLFVMISAWGLVKIVINTFSLEKTPPTIPGVPSSNPSSPFQII